MAVPTYDYFIEPVLRVLAASPEEIAARSAQDAAADRLGLNSVDREELLPSGTQVVFRNRANWAHDRLKRAGLSMSPRRGFWRLTESGRKFAREHADSFSEELREKLASAYTNVSLRGSKVPYEGENGAEVRTTAPVGVTPDERLEVAVAELHAAVAAELLEVLAGVHPEFFETVVLDLLYKLGYGSSRADLQRIGKSGDGGVDGVISLDRLGLDKVYVQAKRWQGSVGRPDVQGFYGALAGQRASKGVMITTSTFSSQAHEFAKSVDRLVLVDGRRLADLMIEFEVGVTLRPVRVPKLDSDYFDVS